MELALSLVRSGSLPQARALYKQICQADKNNAEAWIMLGAIEAELGNLAEAISCQRRAVAQQPQSTIAHMHLANTFLRLGQLEDAQSSCQTALGLQPDLAAAWFLLARVHMQSGRNEEAESCCHKAITLKPGFPEAHFVLGKVLHAQKKLDECIKSYREALRYDPGFMKAHYRLGIALYDHGELEEAAASYNNALRINPSQPAVHFNLGIIFQGQNRLEAAETSYREALRLKPDHAKAYANLGYVLRLQGKIEDAVTNYQTALRFAPDSAEIHFNLGMAQHDLGRYEDAAKSFQAAVRIKPDYAEAYHYLGVALSDLGKPEEAAESYRKALDISDNAVVRIKLATLLPVMLESNEQIAAVRRHFDEEVSDLLGGELSVDDPLKRVNQTNFYLVYHGQNDRTLQEKVARLYEKACPALLYTAPHCNAAAERETGKMIRVGFISSYFCNHTIGIVMKDIVARLSRDLFTVIVFATPHKEDGVRRYIRQHSDEWITLPNDLSAARKLIAEQRLDVLFYTDIGMDPFTYFMAFSRLAPVQCTTWGHPVTTGIRNMDYYVSCKYFEPENAQEHYSEKLVCLDSPLTYYHRPTFSPRVARSHYGLTDNENLYLCPQTIFKFHPDFDAIMAGILRADPNGRLVLVDSSCKYWTELLLNRFKKAMPDVLDRITVLPYPGFNHYLNLLNIADVMLDTLHYGGGSTSLQALAAGTPIVTLPSNFQRGRHTYAYYKKMGYTECVAKDKEDYVQKAVRLGTDKAYREKVRNDILAANSVLYENQEVVLELERFLATVVRKIPPNLLHN